MKIVPCNITSSVCMMPRRIAMFPVFIIKNLDGNISAFVSRIRKSSDSVRIEYLHVTSFKLHHKTFVKMQEFDDFADYVDQLIH